MTPSAFGREWKGRTKMDHDQENFYQEEQTQPQAESQQDAGREVNDMTYFIDYYSAMLSRSVDRMKEHLLGHVLTEKRMKKLVASGRLNDRQIKGAPNCDILMKKPVRMTTV